MKMNMETLVVALLVALILVSGIQAYQIAGLKTLDVGSAFQKTSSIDSSVTTSQQQASTQMVGGC